MFLECEGGCEHLVNQRAVFGEDAIDFRSSVADLAGKNHTMGAGPQTLKPSQLPFERFDVAPFLFEPAQREAERFSGFRGQLPEKLNNLRGKVYLCHASRSARG